VKNELNTWFSPNTTGKFYKLETVVQTIGFGFTGFKPKPKPASNHDLGLVWFQQTMVLVCWFLGFKPNQEHH
jgi:hypothetical protein